MHNSIDEYQLTLRVPPHSIEAESSLLGALLLNNAAHGLIVGLVKPGDFYRYEHKEIFKAIDDFRHGRLVDTITTNLGQGI